MNVHGIQNVVMNRKMCVYNTKSIVKFLHKNIKIQ